MKAAALAAGLLAAVLAGAAGAEPAAAAEWQRAGQRFVVELAAEVSAGARRESALQHYVIGVAALPVAVVQPPVALAAPFYLLFAPPWQAVFNARAERLAQVLAEAPMPDAVIQALQRRWRGADAPLQATLRLAAYGLSTRSGRQLSAFETQEELCLVADAVLEIVRPGGAPEQEAIVIGPESTTRDAPPPLCASMGRWADDEGRLLRQGRTELAALLAAFIVDRVEARR